MGGRVPGVGPLQDRFVVVEDTRVPPMGQVTQKYSSDFNQLGQMRMLVRQACREAWLVGDDDEILDQIELALQEAATNVIRHAYEGALDRPIQVVVDADPRQVRISLFHEGRPFDPAMAEPPAFDGSRLGGWGLYLIEQLMDEVSYSFESGRNEVRLVKNRS